MRLRATQAVWIALALGLAVWWFARVGAGPEAELRGRLDRIEELLEKRGDEGALESAERARRLGDVFLPSFALDLPQAGGVSDRESLVRPFVGLRRQAETIAVDFSEVDVLIEGARARTEMTATVRGVGGERTGDSRYRVTIGWQLDDGIWRIAEAQAVEADGLF
ncbi:MAG: hypothetical protein AAGN46_10260 [Acidobacteriota bacterium]